MASVKDEPERQRVVFRKWSRPKGAPVIQNESIPKGATTPDGLSWGHDVGSFFWFPRIPNVNAMMIWTRSMIKELGENYDEAEFPGPEPKPRVRKPWPVLTLPTKVQKELKLIPPLGVLDEGSDHEPDAVGIVVIHEADRGERVGIPRGEPPKIHGICIDTPPKQGENGQEGEKADKEEGNDGKHAHDGAGEPADSSEQGPKYGPETEEGRQDLNEGEDARAAEEKDGNEGDGESDSDSDILLENDPEDPVLDRWGHPCAFVWAPHVRVELFMQSHPFERLRSLRSASPHMQVLFLSALDSESAFDEAWRGFTQEQKTDCGGRGMTITPANLPPDDRNCLLAIQMKRVDAEERRKRAPWCRWDVECFRVVYEDDDIDKVIRIKGKAKKTISSAEEAYASRAILNKMVKDKMEEYKKTRLPPWKTPDVPSDEGKSGKGDETRGKPQGKSDQIPEPSVKVKGRTIRVKIEEESETEDKGKQKETTDPSPTDEESELKGRPGKVTVEEVPDIDDKGKQKETTDPPPSDEGPEPRERPGKVTVEEVPDIDDKGKQKETAPPSPSPPDEESEHKRRPANVTVEEVPDAGDKGKQKEMPELPPFDDESKPEGPPVVDVQIPIPNLEEFIPEAFFPDILMVHDPDNVTPGNGGDESDDEDDEEVRPIKYRRVFPTDEQLGRRRKTKNDTSSSSTPPKDDEPLIAHAHLSRSSFIGEGHHSLVYTVAFKPPPPIKVLSPDGHVSVVAKLAKPPESALRLLNNEGRIYSQFPKHLMEERCGYNLVKPIHHPVPVGAIVPKFYGYWKPVEEDEMCGDQVRSPILLLEDCGRPVRANEFSPDQRSECMSMLFRLHWSGFLQGSSYERNFCLQPGPLTQPLVLRSMEQPSLRMIDFGRAVFSKDLVAMPYGQWKPNCPVLMRRQQEVTQATQMFGGVLGSHDW